MKENNISKLQDHLFDTLESLKNKDTPMDIDKAKAIADVSQVIINSAKVECEHLKITGGTGTDFIEDKQITGPVRVHKLRG
jgi:hypothetical protein